MAKLRKPAPAVDLPDDLVAFLTANKRLEYDPADCEAGVVTLLPLSKLKLKRFPVETSGSPVFEQDPHFPKVNSYLVLGVNLVAGCEHYDPVGILMWLPIEARYGVWDSSHCTIQMFGPKVTWSKIAAEPALYINAGWRSGDPEGYPDSPRMEDLVPWHKHPYGKRQVYTPQPAEPRAARDRGRR